MYEITCFTLSNSMFLNSKSVFHSVLGSFGNWSLHHLFAFFFIEFILSLFIIIRKVVCVALEPAAWEFVVFVIFIGYEPVLVVFAFFAIFVIA